MALKTYLTGIADAIREKKGTTDPINAQDFASEIASISTGGGTGDNPLQALVSGRRTAGGAYLCYYYTGSNVDFLSNIDFSAVTNMSYMFNSCANIITIPLIDTSNVTNMSYMFQSCANIITIPLIDTSNVTNMSYMFHSCGALTALPQLDTGSVTNMKNMFASCYSLPTIDITKLTNNNNSNFANYCQSLVKFIIRTMDTIPTFGSAMFQNCYHFTGTVNDKYNPEGLQDGRIYVPDAQVDALKAATGWANYADIIVPLSTLVED